LLFDIESHKLLDVEVAGKGTSKLVHARQTVSNFGGAIKYFIDSVFNYPILAECR